MFTPYESPFERNIVFHNFRNNLKELTQKIQTLTTEKPDPIIQKKLIALDWVKNECHNNIAEYNKNYVKYAEIPEYQKHITHIFLFRTGLLLLSLLHEKESMLVDLLSHRSYSGTAYSYLPFITGAITGVVACVVSGPLLGVVGGLISTKALLNTNQITASAPKSFKVVFDLLSSTTAEDSRLIKNTTKISDVLTILWVSGDEISVLKDNCLYFRKPAGNVEIWCPKGKQWVTCKSLTQKDVVDLIIASKSTIEDPQTQKLFIKLGFDLAYAYLDNTAPVKTSTAEVTC